MEAAKNRIVEIDGSGDLLPGKQHVRSLRAGVGSSFTMHRVRSHQINFMFLGQIGGSDRVGR